MSEQPPLVGEQLETAGLEALHTHASDELSIRMGMHLEHIDGATVSIAANEPSPLLNRAVGLGLYEPATRDGVDRICDAFGERGVEHFYVAVHPAARPDDIGRLLEDAGLEPGRGWMKFARGPGPAPRAESSLEVREIGEDHIVPFGEIAASAYGMTPEAASVVRGLLDCSGVHLYMTFDGDQPAGTGALTIDGDRAWFDWAATNPVFRRRGSQRALLARRIEDAIAAGCTRLMTCTGEAVPGDPQHSYHNIEWAGFEPQFVRENWVPR